MESQILEVSCRGLEVGAPRFSGAELDWESWCIVEFWNCRTCFDFGVRFGLRDLEFGILLFVA